MLNLEQSEFMLYGLTQSSGVRAVVFNPNATLLPDEKGFDLASKSKTSVGIVAKSITRKEHPYEHNCTANWNSTFYKEENITDQYTLLVSYYLATRFTQNLKLFVS